MRTKTTSTKITEKGVDTVFLMCSVSYIFMIDLNNLPETIQFDMKEALSSIKDLKFIITISRRSSRLEQSFLTSILTSTEEFIINRKNLETIDDFENQLKNIDDIYNKLKKFKALNIDLTRYEKYRAEYIDTFMYMWRMGDVFKTQTGVSSVSFKRLQEITKDHLLPMLAFQIVGSILLNEARKVM